MKFLIDYDGIEKNILSGSYVVHQASCQGLPRRHRRQALQVRPRQGQGAAGGGEAGERLHRDDGFRGCIAVERRSAQALQASFGQAGIKLDIHLGRAEAG